MGQLPIVRGAWTCSSTKPQAVEHIRKGSLWAPPAFRHRGQPEEAMGWQRSCFSSQTCLSGPSSSIPQLWGSPWEWEGLFHCHVPGPPGPQLLMGTQPFPLGHRTRGNGLAAPRCWQSLQPPIGFTGACEWGCSRCPAGDSRFRRPLGRKNIGSLSCRRWHEEAALLLSRHTRAGAVVAPWQRRDGALQDAGLSPYPCPGLQEPQSRAASPGAGVWQVPAGMAFSRPPPPSFGKISLFLCWMGRGP